MLAALEQIAEELGELRELAQRDQRTLDTLRRVGPGLAQIAAEVLERTLRRR